MSTLKDLKRLYSIPVFQTRISTLKDLKDFILRISDQNVNPEGPEGRAGAGADPQPHRGAGEERSPHRRRRQAGERPPDLPLR